MMNKILILAISIIGLMVTNVFSQESVSFHKDVNVREFNDLIKSGEGTLVDVRTEEEFSDGHIEGASNVVYSMFGFSGNIRDMDKEETYYIYCRSGARSGKSLNIMKKMGFTKVYNLSGGILKWRKEGMPITK